MDPEQVAVAERAVVDLMRDVEAMIDSRLAERGDDLISGLLDAEEQGDRLTHDEVVTMVGNLIVGGESHDGVGGSDMLIRKLDKVTVFAVGYGSRTEPPDLAVLRVDYPDRVFQRDHVRGTIVVKDSKVLKNVYPGQPIRKAVLN